jgi:predicted RNase H-like HicB family nuclease
MRAEVRLELKVPIKVFQGEAAYIAHCPVFDVSSQGDTKEQARKNVAEALASFVITCFELGTLDEVLKESGFKPLGPSGEQSPHLLQARPATPRSSSHLRLCRAVHHPKQPQDCRDQSG